MTVDQQPYAEDLALGEGMFAGRTAEGIAGEALEEKGVQPGYVQNGTRCKVL